MGDFMNEDDHHIPSILETMNLRFAPSEPGGEAVSGILEMAELQRKFTVFSDHHSFKDSVAVLNLVGNWPAAVKAKWYRLLEALTNAPSDLDGVNGNDRIVRALSEHLGTVNPMPVYFTAHDSRVDKRVLVKPNDQPIFYIEAAYLTISLPMRPKRASARRKAR